MMSQAKHIAGSGLKQGQWVNCPAQHQCTLSATKNHTTFDELQQTRVYIEEATGRRVKSTKDVTLVDVMKYRLLSNARQVEFQDRVQADRDLLAARREAVAIRKRKTALTKPVGLPEPTSQEALDHLNSTPDFKHELRVAAMRGYRSYDVGTIAEGVEEAGSELYMRYNKQKSKDPYSAHVTEVIKAHHKKIGEQLKPMVTSYFLFGHL
jgi:hypothetical protein